MVGSLQSGRHFSNLVDVDGTQRGIGATDAEGCGDAFLIKLKTFYVAYGEPSISSQCFFQSLALFWLKFQANGSVGQFLQCHTRDLGASHRVRHARKVVGDIQCYFSATGRCAKNVHWLAACAR
ncbi:hypothetical protein D3C84_954320 [compost metagenome]